MVLLWGVQNPLFNPPIQVVSCLWRGLVVHLSSWDAVVVLRAVLIALASPQPGCVLVLVAAMVMAAINAAVCLPFVMLVMLQAVLVRIAVVMEEAVMATVIIVDTLNTHGFFWVQGGPLTLRCGAVLPHFVNKEYL